MDYKLEITRKSDSTKHTFQRLILNADIDRRADMGASQATFNISNTVKDLTDFRAINGIIDNYNKIEFFVNNEVQFSGFIKTYKIDTNAETIEITAQDEYFRLLKAIDPKTPFLIYKNIMASDMVLDLCKRAGMTKVKINRNEIKDYKITKEMKIKYDTQFSDVIEEAITTMQAKGLMLKDGTFLIGKQYPLYLASDVKNNIRYDWWYEDFVRVSSAGSRRSTDTMYPRLLIRFKDNIYNIYEEPKMKQYLNNENKLSEIETILADTEEKRTRIANKEFLNMWRRNTTLDIVNTRGNLKIDLMQVVRLKLRDDVLGHYVVTGIHSNFSPGDVVDQIALEGMREVTELAELIKDGNYDISEEKKKKKNKKKKPKKSDNETYINVIGNSKIEFKISNAGKIKFGYIDIARENTLEIKAYFNNLLETKHYDLVIQDPNKKYYGYKQQILGDNKSQITINNINSCKTLQYSGWEATTEYFNIEKPMPGRWYVYLQSDTIDDYKAHVNCNLNWKRVKI